MIGKLSTLLLLTFVMSSSLKSQKSLDLSTIYPPGSGIYRNFSIYEPKNFKPGDDNKLLIGFHPYNPGTWNAITWRDTLKSFVELVDALLVCPDGGSNGRVDDIEDYNFTEALIDTIKKWYTVDPEKVFAIGFSVGGKAVYEFGLKHDKEIKGMIPIGAAIDGVDFSSVIHKAKCNTFYLIHGNKDSPNSRYFPMKADLEVHEGLVNSILMANIGHTINFPNRNTILKRAFDYVDTAHCNTTGIKTEAEIKMNVYPSVLRRGDNIKVEFGKGPIKLLVYYQTGAIVRRMDLGNENNGSVFLGTDGWGKGLHLIVIDSGKEKSTFKVLID